MKGDMNTTRLDPDQIGALVDAIDRGAPADERAEQTATLHAMRDLLTEIRDRLPKPVATAPDVDKDEAVAKALWEIDDPEPTYGWDRARANGVYQRMARAAREHIETETDVALANAMHTIGVYEADLERVTRESDQRWALYGSLVEAHDALGKDVLRVTAERDEAQRGVLNLLESYEALRKRLDALQKGIEEARSYCVRSTFCVDTRDDEQAKGEDHG